MTDLPERFDPVEEDDDDEDDDEDDKEYQLELNYDGPLPVGSNGSPTGNGDTLVPAVRSAYRRRRPTIPNVTAAIWSTVSRSRMLWRPANSLT